VATWSPNSDVKRGYPSILSNARRRSSSLHRGIRRTLQAISLNMLPASASGYCFSTAQIGYVNQCVVE
jgi:hypothetical protein